jgi:hypothetical protein
MTAKALIKKLEEIVAKEGGNWPVEIETPREIMRAMSVRFAETDAERGCSIIIAGNGSTL